MTWPQRCRAWLTRKDLSVLDLAALFTVYIVADALSRQYHLWLLPFLAGGALYGAIRAAIRRRYGRRA